MPPKASDPEDRPIAPGAGADRRIWDRIRDEFRQAHEDLRADYAKAHEELSSTVRALEARADELETALSHVAGGMAARSADDGKLAGKAASS